MRELAARPRPVQETVDLTSSPGEIVIDSMPGVRADGASQPADAPVET